MNDFLESVLDAMDSESKRIRKSQIDLVFYGMSVKSPFHFRQYDLLEKVHTKIRAIEESREFRDRSNNGSVDDLSRGAMLTDPKLSSSPGQSMGPVQVHQVKQEKNEASPETTSSHTI